MSDTTVAPSAAATGYDWESFVGSLAERYLTRRIDVDAAKRAGEVYPGYVPTDDGWVRLTGSVPTVDARQLGAWLPWLVAFGVALLVLRKL